MRDAKRECATIRAAQQEAQTEELRAQLDDEYQKAAVKLKGREARLNYFCKQTGRTKIPERGKVFGFSQKENRNSATSAEKYYKAWSKSIGADKEVRTLAQYYEMKHTRPQEFQLLKGYVNATEKGDISSLVGFDLYKETASKANQELVGMTAVDGTVIKGFKTHFIDVSLGKLQNHMKECGKGLQFRMSRTPC